ncbi:hypothetical protein QGM71_18275 [Virgibacillus sp. C22-A2]|uniref:Beta-ketoacyl synthase N-terminal domain-containing protein n=1 Tax=Virgibacillus tibetensis TaxID=3042313 RepID=A0ABU6KK02_9BACI|nr:hypothetical protein [Virgibacillus sp. C22-A2]
MSRKVYINKIFYKKFFENGEYIKNESLIEFYQDLLKQYRMTVKEEMLEKGYQNPFIHICHSMLENINRSYLDDVDLVLLAHDTPDIDPSYSTTSYLSHKFNLGSRCIAITNLGKNVGLGAVNLAKELIKKGDFTRILILLTEQNTLPYTNEKKKFIDIGLSILLTSDSQDKEIFTIDEYDFVYFDDRERPNLEKILCKINFDPESDLIFSNMKVEDTDQSHNKNYFSTKESSRTLQSLMTFSEFVSQIDIKIFSKILLIELDEYNKKIDCLKVNIER